MLIDAREIEQNAEIQGDIAIIGAGAAGIPMAIELSKQFKSVILLESGGLEFDQQTQDLNQGKLLGHDKTGVDLARLRFLGGTTNHWEGQCTLFEPVDFERLADRPHSGWPFGFDTLEPFYERAYPYCEIGDYRKTPPRFESAGATVRQFCSGPEFELAEFRYSPPTRFGEKYRPDLLNTDRIKLYLNANVTDITAAQDGRSITGLQVRTLTGRAFRVSARAYVLACGGIENPRVLLNCKSVFPAGIGNQHDLVGRFFMDHPSGTVGHVVPQDPNGARPVFSFFDGKLGIRVGLRNTAETVRQPGRRSTSVVFIPELDESALITRGRTSKSFDAVRAMVQDVRRGRLSTVAQNGCGALEDPVSVVSAAYVRATDRFRKPPGIKSIKVHIEGEQDPDPASRVVLTDDVDALGMRRVGLDWRISDSDYRNIRETAMAVARGVGASGYGRMMLDLGEATDLSKLSTGYHHLGTTRMHEDERHGVVDADCRVHGLANLYIAGSSVFPTGGRANPTVTLVALALRLSDHLKNRIEAA